MKIINNFKIFIKYNENTSNTNDVDKIVDTLLDFIDDGEKVEFYSASGNMSYDDYLAKNNNYEKFRPVLKAGNKIISKFTIELHSKIQEYDHFVELLDNMKSAIGRLGEDGWVLFDFEVKSHNGGDYGKKVKIRYAKIIFTKPDVVLDEKFELPDYDELKKAIESSGINVRDIIIGDNSTLVKFQPADYDVRYIEDVCEEMCDLFGFSTFELYFHRGEITFEYSDCF